jgi:hypothetical protein
MKFKRLFKALMLAILTVIGIIVVVMIAIAISIMIHNMLSKVVPLSTLNDIGMILLCIVMPFAMIVIGYYRCIN